MLPGFVLLIGECMPSCRGRFQTCLYIVTPMATVRAPRAVPQQKRVERAVVFIRVVRIIRFSRRGMIHRALGEPRRQYYYEGVIVR